MKPEKEQEQNNTDPQLYRISIKVTPSGDLGLLALGAKGVEAWKKAKAEIKGIKNLSSDTRDREQ